VIGLLGAQLTLHFVRHDARRPDLAMRMRIAGTHHLAAILEDQYVREIATRIELGELCAPRTHDADSLWRRQIAQR
jgi:hypothetical protein